MEQSLRRLFEQNSREIGTEAMRLIALANLQVGFVEEAMVFFYETAAASSSKVETSDARSIAQHSKAMYVLGIRKVILARAFVHEFIITINIIVKISRSKLQYTETVREILEAFESKHSGARKVRNGNSHLDERLSTPDNIPGGEDGALWSLQGSTLGVRDVDGKIITFDISPEILKDLDKMMFDIYALFPEKSNRQSMIMDMHRAMAVFDS